jgi:L-asparagine transporter-like permease
MIGLGGAIGTGLFLGSGLAISQAGPAVIIAYIVCGAIALIIAWALAEMVIIHPTAGSFGVLAHSYIAPSVGFVVRWTYWAIQCIAIGGEVIAGAVYMQFWWPQIPLWLPTVVFSIILIGINVFTVGAFGAAEYVFSSIKIVAIVLFILLGAVLIFFGLPEHSSTGFSNLTSSGGFFPHGFSGLLLALVFVMFSFIGTEVVSVTAAEARNPTQSIRRATRAMVPRLSLFYILALAVVLTVTPWTKTAQVGDNINASPFVQVLSAAGIPAAAAIMNFVVLTAALSSANANLYLTTRMLHSLAAQRYAPKWTGRVTNRGVPALALILSTFGMVIAAILSVVAKNTAYVALFGLSIFGALVVWILILVTHLRFRSIRRKYGLPESSSKLAGAPVTTVIGIVFLLAVLVSTNFIDGLRSSWLAGVPFFIILIIAYNIVKWRNRTYARPYDPLVAEINKRQDSETNKVRGEIQ